MEQDLNYLGNPTQPDIQLPGSDPSFSPPQTFYPYDDWTKVSLPLAATLGDRAPAINYPTDELTAEAREWIDANFPLPPGVCLADLDRDGQSDLADFSIFHGCMSGPGQPVAPGCERKDMDVDGDADLADFAIFQASFGCP
ncbi:MAG: hypothetical protein IIC01_13255 [Planctomycetes bacterium]|nr:hypothetical protein [Planctomycetota bacterium]